MRMSVIRQIEKLFSEINFETFEAEHDEDLCADIDYFVRIGEKAFGIQLKFSNFGNYSATERMRASFDDFTKKYGGKVFIVFSIDDKIQNTEVIEQIREEIKRLQSLSDNSLKPK